MQPWVAIRPPLAAGERNDDPRVALANTLNERCEEAGMKVARHRQMNCRQWLIHFFPIYGWLPYYEWRKYMVVDVLAGLAVALVAAPKAMSYASLADLPMSMGLAGMAWPLLVYGTQGSCKQLGIGPVAVCSLILGNGLQSIYPDIKVANPNKPDNPADQEILNHAAVQVGFMVSLIYLTVGFLKLGWVADFMSHTMISGFMTGAAVSIGLSQVQYILGVKIPRATTVHDTIRLLINAGDGFQWREFTMGMMWLCVLLLCRFVSNRYQRLSLLRAFGPIFITILSICLTMFFKWGDGPNAPIAVVGSVPHDGISVTVHWWMNTDHITEKLGLALTICAIGLCEHVSIAKVLAQTNGYELDVSQEITALGWGNLVAAALGAYTVTGSFSQSSINQGVGAKSQLAGMFTGCLMLITVYFLGDVLAYMPQNVMGAVVISCVIPLIDAWEFFALMKANVSDWFVWCLACFGTMFLGVELGIGLSVTASLCVLGIQAAFAPVSTMGKLEKPDLYCCLDLYPEALPEPGLLIFRVHSPIFFANFPRIRQWVRTQIATNRGMLATRGEWCERIHCVIADLSSVPHMDVTAIHMLAEFVNELGTTDNGGPVRMLFCDPSSRLIAQLRRGGFFQKTGQAGVASFFLSIRDAVEFANAHPVADPSYRELSKRSSDVLQPIATLILPGPFEEDTLQNTDNEYRLLGGT